MKKTSKNIVCEKCNKGFEDNAHLKRHLQKQVPCDKIFKCSKCSKVFPNQSSLTRHDQRKTECAMTEIPVIDSQNVDSTCHMCGNEYASISNLKRHKKNCPVKNDPSILMNLLLKSEQKRLEAERAQFNMERQLFELQKGGVITIQNNNNLTVNNVQNMYVNITICSFGNEDLTKLDQRGVIDLLKGQVEDFMPRMIEFIHANPNHPEFHNVFYDPVRKKALVFKQNQDQQLTWQFEDIEHVSKLLTDKIKDHIHPLNGPYFNSLSKNDTDTANKIPQILCTNWQTPKTVEGTKSSLSKVAKNEGFMDQVSVLE